MNPISFMAFQKEHVRLYESPWNLTSDRPQSCRRTFFGRPLESWRIFPSSFGLEFSSHFLNFHGIGNRRTHENRKLKPAEFGQNPSMLVLPIANAPIANGWNPLPAHVSLCHSILWSIYRLLYIWVICRIAAINIMVPKMICFNQEKTPREAP